MHGLGTAVPTLGFGVESRVNQDTYNRQTIVRTSRNLVNESVIVGDSATRSWNSPRACTGVYDKREQLPFVRQTHESVHINI
jgi:hypothetical protein